MLVFTIFKVQHQMLNTHSDIDDEKIDQDEADGKWYFTKEENGTLMRYHIKKILKSIIPREYVSRERSKRHIASVYLLGMEPVPQNHDIVIFGLSSHTTIDRRRQHRVITPGLMESTFSLALDVQYIKLDSFMEIYL